MDAKQAALSLGITRSTVLSQIRDGRIAAVRSGWKWGIAPEEVERYREARLGRIGDGLKTPAAYDARLAKMQDPAVRAQISASLRGRSLSPEHREKLSAAGRGHVVPDDIRAKMSAANLGQKRTPEQLERIRAAARDPERRAKLSATLTGRKMTPEWIEKMAAGHRGRPLSEQHRTRLSEANVRNLLATGRYPSKLEAAAAALLLPIGFERYPRRHWHAFDFGRGDLMVEVHNCYTHDHRTNGGCGATPKRGSLAEDERVRQLARDHGLALIELWGCERSRWPAMIADLPES